MRPMLSGIATIPTGVALTMEITPVEATIKNPLDAVDHVPARRLATTTIKAEKMVRAVAKTTEGQGLASTCVLTSISTAHFTQTAIIPGVNVLRTPEEITSEEAVEVEVEADAAVTEAVVVKEDVAEVPTTPATVLAMVPTITRATPIMLITPHAPKAIKVPRMAVPTLLVPPTKTIPVLQHTSMPKTDMLLRWPLATTGRMTNRVAQVYSRALQLEALLGFKCERKRLLTMMSQF
jgi:hypothetical protein